MRHPDERQLVGFYYGDVPERATVEEHLRSCSTCRESFESLQRTLDALKSAPVPERDANYGSQVWYAIARRLDDPRAPAKRSPSRWFALRRLAAIGALAAMIVAAFVAGRYWPHTPIRAAATDPAQIRKGVLIVAVSDHLDHAQMVLMELVNAGNDASASQEQEATTMDITREQTHAQELLAENRLYQQTAQQTGDAELENILNALEPVLLEIAHSPDKISSQQFQEIQGRIRDTGILFKVRVVSSEVRDKERSLARQNGQGQT